jgi:hypothetical protein
MERSSFGRLIGVLVSPVKTFASIAERSTWGVALLVLALVIGLVSYLAGTRTDYRDVMEQSFRDSGREIPEGQMESQIEMMEKIGPVMSGIAAPVAVVVISLIAALIYWLAFKLLGSEFSYKSALSVTLHAGMPVVVSMLISLPVILSRSSLGYDDVKSGSFLQSNLAFLAPEDAPAWLIALYASVDFFTLWSLVLSVIGYKAVSRLSTQAVVVTVIVVTLLFVGVRVGLSALR